MNSETNFTGLHSDVSDCVVQLLARSLDGKINEHGKGRTQN